MAFKCVCVWFNLGSHDSMSYDLDLDSFIIEPAHLKRFSRVYGARKVMHKWATTQVTLAL